MNNSSILQIISLLSTQYNLSKQESWWLLQHICKKTREELVTHEHQHLSAQEIKNLQHHLHELTVENKPLAYILQNVPFYELELEVTPPILIPRPETEELVTKIISALQKFNIASFLDIGTGTGCIGLSLAHAFPKSIIMMTDISLQALALAQKNSVKNTCKNVQFIHSNVFENLQHQKFDIIISNPPYIDPDYASSISEQVQKWEDPHALYAQEHGLAIIKNILQNAHAHLTDRNDLPFRVALEVDYTQPETVCNLALQYGFKKSWWKKDNFGKPRFVYCS